MKTDIRELLFAVALIFFYFVQYASAESWEKEVAPQDTIWGDTFKEIYSQKHCSVVTLTDGTGVNLRARDFVDNESTSLMYHQVQIRHSNNQTSIDNSWVYIDTHGIGWGRETGPDLFAQKCVDQVKALPPHVKKQFFGYYDIK